MHLFIASIALALSYLALNMIITSRLILETDNARKRQFGQKLVKVMRLLIVAGVLVPIFIILRPDMWQTYTLVGINLVFLGVNGIFTGISIRDPEADHSTLGRNAKIIAQISKYMAIVAMLTALIWAAWPLIKELICK